jgi:hypothetical protein
MKKFKLKLEELQVASFDTQATPSARGTVRGHESEESGDVSCYGTCLAWTKCGDCTWTGPIETDDCTGYNCTYNCPVSVDGC